MGGHKHFSCSTSRVSQPVILIPDYIVTGDGSPSPNGNYFNTGIYNGRNYYKRTDNAFFIWYNIDIEIWYISDILGEASSFGTWLGSNMILGIYDPEEASNGNPIVTAGS